MARTTINSQGVPVGTITASDLSYPLTDFSSTGIDDNASSNAITISSGQAVTMSGLTYPTSDGSANQVLTTDGSGGLSFADTSSGGVEYVAKTTTYTASANEGIIANTSGGAWTLTLPASPSAGDKVFVADGDDWSTNNLTVARNGSTIEGSAADFVMDYGGVNVGFIYDGSTWQVYPQAGLLQLIGIDDNATSTAITIESTGKTTYSSSANIVAAFSSTNTTGKLTLSDTNDTAFIDINATRLGIGHSSSTSTQALQIEPASAEAIRIDSSSNVGIGTSSPSTVLDIEGVWVNNQGLLALNAASGVYSGLTMQHSGTAKGYLYYDNASQFLDLYSTNDLRLIGGGSERARITSAGKLLLNETAFNSGYSSFATMQISDSTAPGLVINTSTAGASNYGRLAFTIGNSTGNEGLIRYNSNDYHMSFWTNAQERIRITSDGKVGIGRTSPDKELHVNGTMMAGSGSSVGGSDVLIARYSDGSNDQPNILGTSRSSSAWYICYGLRPSTATADTFSSSVDNSTWYRGAFRVGGDYAAFRSNGGSAVNTAVGTTIATSEYVRMDHMGISFNGDTATANHLNDYEEGTWTPVVYTSSGSLTTYHASYTKIGRVVNISTYIAWTNNTGNNSGTFTIYGLPFTNSAGSAYHGLSMAYVGSANMNDALPITQNNSTYIYFHQNDGNSSVLTGANIHSRGLVTIILTGFYITDQ